MPGKNVALRSGSGEGRRLSFINSTAGVLPVRWLIMLLVNYGEPCWLILGTVSFLQYIWSLAPIPQQPSRACIRWRGHRAWLAVLLSLGTRSLPLHNPRSHKHWRQCLSKSISLWQPFCPPHTLSEACLLWSSHWLS